MAHHNTDKHTGHNNHPKPAPVFPDPALANVVEIDWHGSVEVGTTPKQTIPANSVVAFRKTGYSGRSRAGLLYTSGPGLYLAISDKPGDMTNLVTDRANDIQHDISTEPDVRKHAATIQVGSEFYINVANLSDEDMTAYIIW